MSSKFNVPTVKDVCKLSDYVYSMDRSEQVEHLSAVGEADIEAAYEFYSHNHVTSGMKEFLSGATRRLAGKSDQAVFELRQAMGGGKTHNMIALGLLSRFPEIRTLLPDEIVANASDEPARIATINGRDVKNFIWGDIAKQLGKEDEFRDHWINGPQKMTESDWKRMIGDEPTLIMLDELPPYLAVAHTHPVGGGTLLDILKFSLANLFSAAMKLKRCVVVVASLDGAYDDAKRVLGSLLSDTQKELSRGAKSITPVDLNTGEIYDILRKRLFTELPDPEGETVDRVSEAFRDSYQEAIRGKALTKSAEQLADEVAASYPFHPGYKDILALFKENEKFRQTRGLIQFTSNLLRGVWESDSDEFFLVGAQHFDFSDQESRDQVKEIERSLDSALASDVYDSDGSAHAQIIDGERGDTTASQVAALLFIASLSDNTDGVRGLPKETVVEYLVAPGQDPAGIMEAFSALREQCWYLHQRDGERWFFSNIANVRKQIEDKASKIPQDRIDDEMRRRLSDVFRPSSRFAYSELVVLPRIDEVNLTPSKRTCLVLSPDAKAPPESATRLFNDAVYKNAFCVVSGDGSKMLEAGEYVRRLLAIETVKSSLSDNPRHQKDIDNERETSEKDFNSAIKSLFNKVWYPQSDRLREVHLDLAPYQDRGVIQGEKAVESALSGTGAKKLVEVDADQLPGLVQRFEDMLFPANQDRVKWSDLVERAASNPRWIWLPPKGMEEIKVAALDEGRWVEENGYVDKNPPPPQPMVRVARIEHDESTGESVLDPSATNSGKNPEILVASSQEGLDSAEPLTDLPLRTHDIEMWFQARNPENGELSAPYRWTGSINITHERQDVAGTWRVTLDAKPEAEIRWNTSGINPKEGTVYDGEPIEIDRAEKTTLFVYAVKGGVSAEKQFTFEAVGQKREITKERPAKAKGSFDFSSQPEVLKLLRASKANAGVAFNKVRVKVGEGDNSLDLRSGNGVQVNGENLESMIEALKLALGKDDAHVEVRITGVSFPDGYALKDFADNAGVDIPVDSVEQE